MSDRDRPAKTVRLIEIFDDLNGIINSGLYEHQLHFIAKEIKSVETRLTNAGAIKEIKQ